MKQNNINLSQQYKQIIINYENKKEELYINNFDYQKEYIKKFKFIMTNSYYISVNFFLLRCHRSKLLLHQT